MRIAIPISTCIGRVRFLRSCLRSLARHSLVRHAVILVTETLEEITAFAQAEFQDANLDIYVLPGIRRYVGRPAQNGEPLDDHYNPVYEFINRGIELSWSMSDWVMLPVGDDSYFPLCWETLLDAVQPMDHDRMVWVPRMVDVIGAFANAAERNHYGGPNVGAVNKYAYVIPAQLSEKEWINSDGCIAEDTVLSAAHAWQGEGFDYESPRRRDRIGWAHSVIHRQLLDAVGMYTEYPVWESNDLEFHSRLYARDIIACGVRSSVIVNCKVPIRDDGRAAS